MSDKNWEQELAKFDKQVGSLSDDQLLQLNNPQRAGTAPVAGARPASAAKAVPVGVPSKQTGSWFAWVQLAVAIGAATGLWFWPWGTRCGLNAVAFTAATGAVTLLGLWSAIGSWRHRQGYAHVLSFAVMIWGLVLGAREVLPRVGYAVPTLARPAGWTCESPTSAPTISPSIAPGTPPGTAPTGTPPGIVPTPGTTPPIGRGA
jgi:hypothetical protein